ncbi:polysaccharide biosynthesis protein [Pseudidiomarina aquimaris]|uniref:Polysaccharide biosynthesis protein n=1 Tax=Pseudidiomarina aquimaris TaxID=641841 RepID=A0A432XD65_9GAMM|nr:phenylacetate--CoA ligase family protein [Pseudidiomarina aquimaris]RUO46620.1 polysaccharide biosynthesis protein [Pseudidiomarina aquimaris]
MKKYILKYAPIFIQNFLISIYNSRLYHRRHTGLYRRYRKYFADYENASLQTLISEQQRRLKSFLCWATTNSTYYSSKRNLELSDFDVLEKSHLIENLEGICTISESDGVVSLTGGTTGASMKVVYTSEDVQERHALLDHFREQHGYKLGKRVAWFSGKDIVRQRDISKGYCYRDDWLNKIRFFSTFHINQKNFDVYWRALENFEAEFLVGFPSSVYDICLMAKQRGLRLRNKVKVFFPTAEVVLKEHRDVIGDILGCRLVDQYASSEGAPFILECEYGNLHIHLLSGVFEVVDINGKSASEGELLVTSFTTRGTPLIRYRIGDSLVLDTSNQNCDCGSHHPLVKQIVGRSSDFIWSPEHGKVNLGNISNCTKGTSGIVQFQVHQESPDAVRILLVTNNLYSMEDEIIFLDNLQSRLGSRMQVELKYVNDIPREKSGKYRIVKNDLSEEQLKALSE